MNSSAPADRSLPPSPGPSPTGRPRRRTTLPRSTRGWSRGIVWTLIGLTAFGAVYGSLAQIDTSVNARGKLVTVKGPAELSPAFTALVEQVLVREGQQVKAGQPVLRLRDTAAPAVVADLEAVQRLLNEDLAIQARLLGLPAGDGSRRLSALAEEQRRTRAEELRQRQAISAEAERRTAVEQAQQQSDEQGLVEQLRINTSITERLEKLLQEGAIAQLEVDRQREQLVKLRAAVERQRLEGSSAASRRREAGVRREQVPTESRSELLQRFSAMRQQLLDVQRQLAEQRQRRDQLVLTTPIAGTVFDLSAKRGELAGPNKVSLKVVPAGAMQVKIFISNSDIGFIRPGMLADVRVDSYPFTEYGSLTGKLTRIGVDSLPPDPANPMERFPASVSLDQEALVSKGRRLELRSGMAVTALIKLQKRPVISLITDRFQRFFDSSQTLR
ncbi:MAG: HlyD family efflux transporter periplasmic adaptor subunit [Chitinophagaceae bacterium]|nr:HlyD family efflux transporter periplasmic adaptor subunit [Chitinophagaceae bacterium]